MTRPGIEPLSPGPLANTLPTRPMSQFIEWQRNNHQSILYLKQKITGTQKLAVKVKFKKLKKAPFYLQYHCPHNCQTFWIQLLKKGFFKIPFMITLITGKLYYKILPSFCQIFWFCSFYLLGTFLLSFLYC